MTNTECSSIQAVIFDYGKVLTYPQPPEYMGKMAYLLGVVPDELQSAYYAFRNLYDTGFIDGKEYWERIISQLKLPKPAPQVIQKLIDIDVDSWSHINIKVWQIAGEIRKVCKTAVLSNNVHEFVERMRIKLGFDKHFDVVVFSNLLHLVKPDPAIYHYCLKELKVDAVRAVFIDDKEENIETAKKLGMKTILFQNDSSFSIDLTNILPYDICNIR